MPAEDMTITAQWTADEYSITYHLDGGTNDEANPAKYTIETEAITLKAATKTGYTFQGWYDADTGGNQVTQIAAGSTGGKTLYARWSANGYTVTFDAQGGEVEPASQQVTYDATYGTLPEVTKAGHTFQGWFTEATGGTEVTAETTVKTAEDHTLYAQWEISEYTITFVTDGGTAIDPIKADYGAAITPPDDPTREGYTFDGWDKDIPSTMPAEDMTITAQWTADEYSITYHLDGGTNDEANPAKYTIEDEAITLKAATKTGYTFQGWYDADTGGNQVTQIAAGSTGGKTLYARWSANGYTVTFDAQGGEVEPASQQVTYDATYGTLPEVTKAGHTFQGWFTEATGGTEVTAETTVKTAEDHTLYAQWEISEYTITFVTDGGTAIDPIKADYGAAITPPDDPTREGYTFDGWDKDIPSTMPAEDMTITAQWTADEYSITYHLDGGTNDEANPAKYTIEDEAITLKAATKTGYTFQGWYDADTGGNQVTQIAAGSTGGKTLYARWSANGYTVTFDAQGGEVEPASQQVTYDATYGTLPEVTKAGHTFQGWFTEATGGTEVTAETTVKTAEDHTLYAQWEISEYTITFVTDGGTAIDPIKADYGAAITPPDDPTREGYTFDGWDKDIPSTMPAEDMTITAQWTADEYSITYHLDGGTNDEANPAKYTIEDEAITLKAATKTGYTFQGWYDADTGGNQVTQIAAGSTGGKTLYARWSANGYTVTFDAQGGEVEPASQQVTYDATYGTLPEVTKAGHTFQGWFTEATGGTEVTAETTVKTAEDHTLYAQWEISEYTITFVTDGGTAIDPIKADYGTAITAPSDPTREGYTFKGWDQDIPSHAGRGYDHHCPVDG
jgi:uncharacterized repeat protein (TIGR02543 family)